MRNGVSLETEELETTDRSGKGNFVSCHGNVASFLLEMNDIWNIHNHTNTWHFSSFTNPELEILFCFIGRLQGISDRGSIILSAQLSWYLGFPGFSRLLWGFLASNMTKVQLHRPTAQREMPWESTARDGSSAWHCFPLASGPGLPEGCGLKSGFTTVPHWVTSFSVTNPKRCVFYCAVSLHMDAFCTCAGLKRLPQTCLTQKVTVSCGVRRVKYVDDFI